MTDTVLTNIRLAEFDDLRKAEMLGIKLPKRPVEDLRDVPHDELPVWAQVVKQLTHEKGGEPEE